MRRAIVAALSLVLLALGAYFVITQLADAVPPPSAEGSAPASVDLNRPSDATLAHVAYVHDGDTLFLQPEGTTSRSDQVKVRLIGVDTPELQPEVECYAVEARDHLRALLPEGAEVWVTADEEALDRFGRNLYYVWTKEGHFVNLDLIANGYATALRIQPNEAYWPELRDAEVASRSAGLGQWGTC